MPAQECKRDTFGNCILETSVTTMVVQLPITTYDTASRIFDAALNAAKTTMKDKSERRVFIQDFAAALNRRGVLWGTESVETFIKAGYEYMGTGQ